MHELSIVMSIVDIAGNEALKAKARKIEEIELDIGTLSTVEMGAFEFAWNEGVKFTVLEGAVKKIHRIKGKAKCMDCSKEFNIQNIFDPCPLCGSHFLDIIQGKELRVKSLVIV